MSDFNVMMARLRASDSPFLSSVADEMGRMDSIMAHLECDFVELHKSNTSLQTENAELRESVAGYRAAILKMNTRSIVNTRSVQIFDEIEQIIERARNLEQMPTAAINTIGTLLDIIKEEANTNGITG